MKKFIIIFFTLFVLSSQTLAISVLDFTKNNENSSEKTWIFSSILEYIKKNKELSFEENKLKNEQTKDFGKEELTINTLIKQKNEFENKIRELKKEDAYSQIIIVDLEKNIEQVTKNIENESKILNQKIDNHLESIELYKKNIEEISEELIVLKNVIMDQSIDIGIFLTFIIILFIFRYISAKAINKFSDSISIHRRSALLRINKIIFNIIISIFILFAFFSQITNILPFLAILGTALAFALRDIITSFIGWFVVGGNNGYKVGDLIQVGDKRGRVKEVSPFLTVVKQTGLRGDNGRIMTFPNKFVFEEKIENFSKIYKFIYIMCDFVLSHDANIDEAKKMLLDTMNESLQEDIKEAEKNITNLQIHFGIKSSNINPKVFIEPDIKGILLRGKFLCKLDNRHSARSNITEGFYKKIQKSKNVDVRFVNFGV